MDEYDAGDGQTIVVYQGEDTGSEFDPHTLAQAVAEDSRRRAAAGQRVVAMTSIGQRHGQVALGRAGSGFVTKAAIIVLYAPS